MEEELYYVDDATNTQRGPCSVNELGALWAASSVSSSTRVWTDGQAGWLPLSALLSLHAQVILKAWGSPHPLPSTSFGEGGYAAGGGGHAVAKASGDVRKTMKGESNASSDSS